MIDRGEIWWSDLGEPNGSGPGYRRPVLVVQGDTFNRSMIATVVVATMTSNVRLSDVPGNVFVARGRTGMPKDSVANLSQLFTVDRGTLENRIGRLTTRQMQHVDRALRLVLDL